MPKNPKTDCFAYLKTNNCNALKKLYCASGNCKCNFYMTNEEYKKKHGETYEETMRKLNVYNKRFGNSEEEY